MKTSSDRIIYSFFIIVLVLTIFALIIAIYNLRRSEVLTINGIPFPSNGAIQICPDCSAAERVQIVTVTSETNR